MSEQQERMVKAMDQKQRMAEMMFVLTEAVQGGDVVGMAPPVEGHRFLVINPKYHDGQRASFLVVPDLFYRRTLIEQIGAGLDVADLLRTAQGRVLAVTEKEIAFTLTTPRRIAHVLCEPAMLRSEIEPETGQTIGSLYESAQKDGWMIASADHRAFFEKLAEKADIESAWKYCVPTREKAMRTKGGVA